MRIPGPIVGSQGEEQWVVLEAGNQKHGIIVGLRMKAWILQGLMVVRGQGWGPLREPAMKIVESYGQSSDWGLEPAGDLGLGARKSELG